MSEAKPLESGAASSSPPQAALASAAALAAKAALHSDVAVTYQKVLTQGHGRFHLPELTTKAAFEKHMFGPILKEHDASNIDEALTYLKSFNSPPVRCGHVFGDGEPTYTCAECGVDPTCVLCHKCFMKSEHRTHQFSVHISHGGGCCDCGDQEAWRGHAFCRIHQPHGGREPTAADALAKVPFAVQKRLYDAVSFALNAAAVVFIDDGVDHVVPEVDPPRQCTTMYNDEVHTFDQVIGQLHRAVGSSPDLGRTWANYVDIEGRAVVRVARAEPCIAAAQKLLEIRLDAREQSLALISTQEVLVDVLNWLGQLSKEVDAVRAVVCGCMCGVSLSDIVTNNVTASAEPILKRVLLNMIKLWKRAHAAVRSVIFGSVMLELDYKAVLAVQFAKNYQQITSQHSRDNDEQGGIANISVQIYTVPSLARMLVQEHNILPSMLRCLRNVLPLTLDGKHVNCEQQLKDETTNVVFDIRYVLRNDVGSVLSMFPELIEILKLEQYMDPMVRKVGTHVERETMSHRVAFHLAALTFTVLTRVLEDHNLPQESDRAEAIRLLAVALHDELADNRFRLELYKHTDKATGMRIPPIRVENSAISLHHPIQSFMTRLMCSLKDGSARFDEFFQQAALTCDATAVTLAFVEPALQNQVVMAQFKAGHWVRNGYAVIHQVSLYSSSFRRDWLFEADIGTMQIGCLCLGLSHMVHLIVDRFDLRDWFEPSQDLDEDKDGFYKFSLSALWGLIINLYQARLLPGIGDCARDDVIRQHLLFALATRPRPFSNAVGTLPRDDKDKVAATRIIREIATIRDTPDGAVYSLKDDVLMDANNKFHYLLEGQTVTDFANLSERLNKLHGTKKEFFPATCPIPFRAAFEPLYDIPAHPEVAALAVSCLTFAHHKGTIRMKTTSTEVLDMIVHLYAMGLNRDRQNGTSKVAAAMVAPTSAGSCVAAAMYNAKGLNELPDDIGRGIDWILRTTVELADEETQKELTTLGISKLVKQPASADVAKRRKKKRAGAKRKQLMNKFSKMQSHFKAMMADDDTEEAAPSASAQAGHATHDEDEDEEEEARFLASCIHCQEEADARSADFVVLGCFSHGSVLVPRREPPRNIAQELEGLQEGQSDEGEEAGSAHRAPTVAMDDDTDEEDLLDLGDGVEEEVDEDEEEVEVDLNAMDGDAMVEVMGQAVPVRELMHMLQAQAQGMGMPVEQDNGGGEQQQEEEEDQNDEEEEEDEEEEGRQQQQPEGEDRQARRGGGLRGVAAQYLRSLRHAFSGLSDAEIGQGGEGEASPQRGRPQARQRQHSGAPRTSTDGEEPESGTSDAEDDTDALLLGGCMEWNERGNVLFQSCGHTMHLKCFVGFVKHWVRNKPLRDIIPNFNCPLCRAPSNVALPIEVETAVPVTAAQAPSTAVRAVASVAPSVHRLTNGGPEPPVPHGTRVDQFRALLNPSHRYQNRLRSPGGSIQVVNLLLFDEAAMAAAQFGGDEKGQVVSALGPWHALGQTIVCMELAHKHDADKTRPVPKKSMQAAQRLRSFALTLIKRVPVAALAFRRLFQLEGGSGSAEAAQSAGIAASITIPPAMEPLRVLVLLVAAVASVAPETTQPPTPTPHVPFASCVVVALVWAVLREAALATKEQQQKKKQEEGESGSKETAEEAGPQQQTKHHLEPIETPPAEVVAAVRSAVAPLLSAAGFPSSIAESEAFVSTICARSTTLLRRAVVLHASLREDEGALELPRDAEGCLRELGLPSPLADTLRAFPMADPHVQLWSRSLQGLSASELETPAVKHTLIPLPESFNEVVIHACDRKCVQTGLPMKEPALCLLCGTYVCVAAPCCTRGAAYKGRSQRLGGCFRHSLECGAGAGIFLLVKHGYVLVLDRGQGALLPSPYVDEHGEPDPGLKRSCRLFLNHSKYERLQQQYREHTTNPSFDPARELPGRWLAM